jgi:hypothetical protein
LLWIKKRFKIIRVDNEIPTMATEISSAAVVPKPVSTFKCGKCDVEADEGKYLLKVHSSCPYLQCESCFRISNTAPSGPFVCCAQCSEDSKINVDSIDAAVLYYKGVYCLEVLRDAGDGYLSGAKHFESILRNYPDHYQAQSLLTRCYHHAYAGSKLVQKWEIIANSSLKCIELAKKCNDKDDIECRRRLCEVFIRYANPHAALMHINVAMQLLAEGEETESVPRGILSSTQLQQIAMSRFTNLPPLRFRIGDPVECHVGNMGWKSGMVVDYWYREDSFPLNLTAPYQVRLDGPEGVLIYAPADTVIHIRLMTMTVKDQNTGGVAVKQQGAIDMEKLEELIVRRVPESDRAWLAGPGRVQWLLIQRAHSVLPREQCMGRVRHGSRVKTEEQLAAQFVEWIGGDSIDLIRRQAEDDKDPAKMLLLGDCYVLSVKMPAEGMDADRGYEWYYNSAVANHPEGLTAYAMLMYLTLLPPDKSNDADFELVIPLSNHLDQNHLEMWRCLENAAKQGHLSPFACSRIDNHRNPLFKIPSFCRTLYASHRREYRLLHRLRCNYSECGVSPCGKEYRLAECGKCRARKYCCQACQQADWGAGHDKECALLAQLTREGAGAGAVAAVAAAVAGGASVGAEDGAGASASVAAGVVAADVAAPGVAGEGGGGASAGPGDGGGKSKAAADA